MALALYRTYRPGSLSEVIGQEHVTEPLARALASGRLHHAYLFSGPRGCGKTSTARIMARSLNCQDGPTAEPCGTCRSCLELAPNGPGSIDVVELDAATHGLVEDARDLREKAIYAPAASQFKVYIIDEAHQLSTSAANALLKVIEEPPPHLRFIFATTEPDKIIATIRSRTFHYGFRLVPARTLAEHLAGVCRSEGMPAEAAALAVVARAGAGSVRDSLSVLGQLLAGAGPEGLTYADAVSALGLTDAAVIDSFVEALAQGSAASMFTVVDGVISAGHDPRRFVTDVLDRLRDLIILRVDPSALSKGLVDVPDAVGELMLDQAQSLGLAELSRAADLVSVGLGDVKGATAPRLQLELLCARLALDAGGDDLAALVARLDRLERVVGAAGQRSGEPEAKRPAPPRRPQLVTQVSAPVPSQPAASAEAAAVEPAGGGAEAAVGEPAVLRAAPTPAGGKPAPPAPPVPPGKPAAPSPPAPPGTPAAQVPPAPTTAAAPGPTPGPTAPAGPRSGAAHPPRPAGPESGAAPAAPTPVAAPTPTPGPTRDTRPRPSLDAVRNAWPAVLDSVSASSRVAWFALHGAQPVSLSEGVLAIAVSEPGNVRAITERGHDERLRQAIIDALGMDVSIDVLLDPAAAKAGSGVTAASAAGRPPAPGPGDPGATGAAATQRTGSERPGDAAGARGPGRAAATGARGADLIRAAANAATGEEAPDEPSADDPDLDASGQDGLALITRELGARPIGEIDHS